MIITLNIRPKFGGTSRWVVCYEIRRELSNVILTWHAHASERSGIVQAGSFVFARMRVAFVDVRLAPRPRESLRAIAGERSGSVDANSVMFARRSCYKQRTKINNYALLTIQR